MKIHNTIRLVFSLFLLFQVQSVFGQISYDSDSIATVYIKIVDANKLPIPNIKVQLKAVSTNKIFEHKSNRIGNTQFIVPINEKYNILVNGDLMEVLNIPLKNYQSITKQIKYTQEFKQDDASNIAEHKEPNQNTDANVGITNCTIEILLKNKQNIPLVGEEIRIENKGNGSSKTISTNTKGMATVTIPDATTYMINLKKSANHSTLFIEKDERYHKLELIYEGTAQLLKIEQERRALIQKLREEQVKLQAEVTKEKKDNEALRLEMKLDRERVVKEYLDFSNLTNDLKAHLSIAQAISKKLITFKGHGNSHSTHYLSPLIIVVKNNTPNSISILIENGRKFLSEPNITQNLIVVKKVIIDLKPNETKTLEIASMCIQHDNDCPSEEVSYKVGDMANDNMITLSRCIEKYEYNNSIAQYAMWVFSDAFSIDYIAGYNDKESEIIKNLVETLLSDNLFHKSNAERKMESITNELEEAKLAVFKPIDTRLINFNNPQYKTKVGGNFTYEISKTSEVMIAMFNMQGILVRELYYNPSVARGKHVFDFAFDASIYTDPQYYFKLIVDNKVKLTLKQ